MTCKDQLSAAYEKAGFAAHNRLNLADFYLMMAYKHGDRDSLIRARDRLLDIVGDINAALEGAAQ
jgi:hypothetical protein